MSIGVIKNNEVLSIPLCSMISWKYYEVVSSPDEKVLEIGTIVFKSFEGEYFRFSPAGNISSLCGYGINYIRVARLAKGTKINLVVE